MRILAVLAFVSLLAAQQETKLGTIAGRVDNSVTGQAMPKVVIQAHGEGGGQPASVTSDAEGRFSLTQLQPGRYALVARRADGMFLGEYGGTATDSSDRELIAVDAGQDVAGLEFRLIPRATIAGTVLDRDGEPVRRARILFTELGPYGDEKVTSASNDLTNDRGEFRLYDLYAGAYLVRAVPPLPVRGCCTAEAAMAQKRADTAALPTYYPSAPDAASAAAIAVAPGQEAGGVRIALREAPVYRIRGKIAGLPAGVSPSDLSVMIFPKGFPISIEGSVLTVMAERAGNPRALAASGEFELFDIEPGDYTVTAMRLNSRDRGPFGRVDVTVTDQNVKDVVLPWNANVKLFGAVRVEGEDAKPFEGSVMLFPLDDYLTHTPSARIENGGRWQVEGVLPGQYRLMISGRSKNWYVKSLRLRTASGPVDAVAGGITVNESASGATVEAVLATDGGAVTGTLTAGDAPAPKKMLDLVPEGSNPERSPNWKTTQADEEGRFAFTGVAPGEYRLYAWEEAYAGVSMRFDSAFRKRWENRGMKVSVPLGQTVPVEMKLIDPK